MTIVAKTLSVGTIGWDTSEKLTAAQAAMLASLGLKFGVRYVPLARQSPSAGIDAAEMGAILITGQGLMLVQFSRTSNFTQQQGHDDGEAAAAAALGLGYPAAASLWFDFSPAPSDSAMIAYANGCYSGAVAGGYPGASLGGYFEPGVPLTSTQLYQELAIARYWRSGAQVPDVATRGNQLIQAWPGNRIVAPGIVIDYDMAQGDYLGSYPVAAFAALKAA